MVSKVSRIDVIGQNGNDGDHYPKRVIIAGGRDFSNPYSIDRVMKYLFGHRQSHSLEVVCGGARGADTEGEQWALRQSQTVTKFLPDWDGLGKRAGFVRNAEMADYADVLVAMWDGKSRGTSHMIKDARKKGLDVHVFNYDGELIDTNTNT
tara:strand:+ start:19 stop:471 length:453 start_codon:yes stop_codon:yes gene_type:complete